MTKPCPNVLIGPFNSTCRLSFSSAKAFANNSKLYPLVQQHQRIALITDAHLQALPYFETTFGSWAESLTLVDTQTKPDSSVQHINKLGERIREEGVTLTIALGGGSVMDTAKCAAVVAQKGGPIEAHAGFERIQTQLMPLLCIPLLPERVPKVPNSQ